MDCLCCCYGDKLGMGSALETLCGQAFGAGQMRMLGVYMQRSWVILFITALLMLPIYIWSPPILVLLGQTSQISHASGYHSLSHLCSKHPLQILGTSNVKNL